MASKCLIFAKLLRSNRSFTAAASPLAGRYHSFSSSADPDDQTCSRLGSRGKVVQGFWSAHMKHPFLIEGLRPMCSVDEYKLETVVKVDMPGILKEGLNLQIKNNEIHIEGKEEKDADDEDMVPRIYSGVVDVPPGLYDTDQITATMKFGTLKIVIPKLNPEEMDNPSRVFPMVEFRDWYN